MLGWVVLCPKNVLEVLDRLPDTDPFKRRILQYLHLFSMKPARTAAFRRGTEEQLCGASPHPSFGSERRRKAQ